MPSSANTAGDNKQEALNKSEKAKCLKLIKPIFILDIWLSFILIVAWGTNQDVSITIAAHFGNQSCALHVF